MLPPQANLTGSKVWGGGEDVIFPVMLSLCYVKLCSHCGIPTSPNLQQQLSFHNFCITSVHWFYCPAPLLTVYTATRTAVTSPQLVTFKRMKLALVPSPVMGKRAPSHHAHATSSSMYSSFSHICLTAEGLCCEWLHFAKQTKPKQSCHLTQHAYLNSQDLVLDILWRFRKKKKKKSQCHSIFRQANNRKMVVWNWTKVVYSQRNTVGQEQMLKDGQKVGVSQCPNNHIPHNLQNSRFWNCLRQK